MGCYRRLISDAFRRYNWKTSPVEKCVSRNSFSSTSDTTRLGISQPIFRKSDLQNMKSPNFVAKKFYSADFNKEVLRWYQIPRNIAILGWVGVGVVIPVYYCNSEKVPYTNRGNFVLFSTYLEKKLGDYQFKLHNKGEILGSDHPESIRVEKIGKDIIGALRKKLDEDNKTAHLKEFNWETVVVNDPTTVKAKCYPGGKIVVSTGLLNYLKTDAEIATVIGREVGHAVGRHLTEPLSAILWLTMLNFLTVYNKPTPDLFHRLPRALANVVWATTIICTVFWALFSFVCVDGRDMEADYIGLLMSACAGYDPRIAPEVYEKFENRPRPASNSLLDADSLKSAFPSSHPNGEKRAQELSKPKVMEEALAIYRAALNDKENEKEKEKEKEDQLNLF